ncbi:hypothetical protein PR202_gb04087 [Eleusine coracana subsp. coracana]|uniref:Uncharacterized protein n=1 Tax=Eleusine coracana subsp. coracana TaxID=191504 RepID=A0AAV5E1Z7_ELECO|nr:hypothetical protein PR202_gb04087 [Eleusine coracana subsp. coracana]
MALTLYHVIQPSLTVSGPRLERHGLESRQLGQSATPELTSSSLPLSGTRLAPVPCVLRQQPLCLLLACYSPPAKSSRPRQAFRALEATSHLASASSCGASQKLPGLGAPGGAMAEEKESTSIPLSQAAEAVDPEDPAKSPPRPSSPTTSTRKACCAVLQSWVSRKFMTGCVVLFPVAVTFFITWWFIQFVDGFFSPLYAKLGIDIFEIIVSGGMTMPQVIASLEPVPRKSQSIRLNRMS